MSGGGLPPPPPGVDCYILSNVGGIKGGREKKMVFGNTTILTQVEESLEFLRTQTRGLENNVVKDTWIVQFALKCNYKKLVKNLDY